MRAGIAEWLSIAALPLTVVFRNSAQIQSTITRPGSHSGGHRCLFARFAGGERPWRMRFRRSRAAIPSRGFFFPAFGQAFAPIISVES